MILTYKIKHERDFSRELYLAKKVAEYGIQHKTISSKDVRHIGLKSAISNQILRKYSKSKTAKEAKSVKLTVPNQSIKVQNDKINIPCLKLLLGIWFPKNFSKISQIEIGKEFAYISVLYPDTPKIPEINIVGIDRNTTHHSIVASCLETGKILKLGKSCNHIHHKYKNLRKSLQKQGKLRKVKAIKNRESRIIKDINHKTSRALVEFARDNSACIVMEDLKEIRQTAKQRRKQRYSLHSWSFYQQKMMIEYKAKKLGVSVHYVAPQYTSQRCSRCGHIEQANRKGNLFCCRNCGTVEDSGVNAGFNVAYLHRHGIPQFSIESDMLKGSTDTPKEATL
ncbi:MAG: transposase [Nanoarchaeota archaeon]